MIDKMNSVVRELLDGMLVIRAFNNEHLEEAKFDKANRNKWIPASFKLVVSWPLCSMRCKSLWPS